MMKIGSLFDGSGGFPLAASMCGVEPVWASEVEPYPIAVTRSRFPNMKHLGSVTDVKGNEVEPVDVITFGSPCQDLSVAGKRAGLKHTENGDDETTRSGLFMEAIRIIKEMREATNGEYPRFAVWENVPGAFSSNKGDDFRIVLEEFIRISEPTAVMPDVPKAGWPYADVYCGDGWSLAYRVLDAQYWGVPQRRRRIYLVADFRGQRAGKVSFEREGLRGYFAESGTPREAVAGDAENCAGTADCELIPYTLKIRSGCDGGGKGALIQTDKSATLSTLNDQYLFQPVGASESNVAATLYAAYGTKWNGNAGAYNGENFVPHPVVDSHILDDQGGHIYEGVCGTLRANAGDNQMAVAYAEGFDMYNQQSTGDVSRTLKTPVGGDDLPVVCYSIENHPADSRVNIDDSGKVQTLTSRMGTGGGNVPMVMEPIDRPAVAYAERAVCVADHPTPKIDENGVAFTLNARDYKSPLCAAYAMQGFGDYKESDVASGLKARDYKDATDIVAEVAGVDCRNFTEHEELYPTLQAKENGGQSLNYSGAVRVKYIVRRLTPTECARLQGFPDKWGHPDIKDELTDEEYKFWLNVRNTHAEINGKAVKDYTKEQMLTWYNKLHTDSSEYKMWGNGIALPCALYVMQGIAEAFKED